MTDPHELFSTKLAELIGEAASLDLGTDEATKAMQAVKTFSEITVPQVELVDPEPTTFWGKTKRTTSKIWDNETTRVLIKSVGSVAGVGLVVYSTIKRDHVLQREALNQANQQQR